MSSELGVSRTERPKAYVTMLGRSVWALANSYHAALREKDYLPEKVYILTESTYGESLEKAVKAVEVLSESFGISPAISSEIIQESDFRGAGTKVSATVKQLKEAGFEVALDITPGRKALVAGSLLALTKLPVDRVFYLSISKLDGAAKPYLMIPFQSQRLHDFLEDARRSF